MMARVKVRACADDVLGAIWVHSSGVNSSSRMPLVQGSVSFVQEASSAKYLMMRWK